jgi:hypothetical protein
MFGIAAHPESRCVRIAGGGIMTDVSIVFRACANCYRTASLTDCRSPFPELERLRELPEKHTIGH